MLSLKICGMPHRICGLAVLLVGFATSSGMAQDAPTAPPFEPWELRHSLLDFITGMPVSKHMQEAHMDPLQVEPFAGAPLADPKGLAAKIKAEEIDAKNRILAIRYLGTVDCVVYPEAQEMLIATMKNDPQEPVRYEAVMALQIMLSRGPECESSGMQKFMKAFKPKKPKVKLHTLLHPHKWHTDPACQIRNKKLVQRRHDFCRGCCNEAVLNALAERAYGTDETGCPLEPSERIREAAVAAAELCVSCCYYCNEGYDAETVPEPAPGVLEEDPIIPPAPEEEPPAATDGPNANADRVVQPISHSVKDGIPTVNALRGFCVVNLKQRQFLPASREFTSVHEGRRYYFATQESKDAFDSNPDLYAPAYAGIDPVEFIKSGETVEGNYLREYNGRFFLFSSKSNWEQFQSEPQKYVTE